MQYTTLCHLVSATQWNLISKAWEVQCLCVAWSLQKYSAGLINKTERSLAEKAGHLEMLKGGKKGKKDGAVKGSKGKAS